MEIISRKEAKAAGLARYFTGKPCKNGHVTERNTRWKTCLGCSRVRCNSHYHSNYEKISEWRKNKRATDEEFRTKENARTRKWMEQNPERRRAIRQSWRQKNREKHNESVRAYYARNPIKAKAWSSNRKALRRAAEGKYTPEDIKRILMSQNGKCAYCRERLRGRYHIDHIIPIAAGGSNWPSNIQLTCDETGNKCNLKKSNKDPIIYARELGRLL